jgi:DNA-binding transcriptional ArsR family regulator
MLICARIRNSSTIHIESKVIDRAVEVLDCFTFNKSELSVGEVSAATGLHKSTAHRILMALEYNGLVEQNQETAKYRLGIKFFKLGQQAVARRIMDVAEDIVRPIMQKPVRIGKASLTMGYAGVYSSFLLHADKAAEQFGVDPRDVLVEVGKRGAVGGQEDILVEIAMTLAQKNAEVEAIPSRRLG